MRDSGAEPPQVWVWGRTDAGLVRADNQDSFVIAGRRGERSQAANRSWSGSLDCGGVLLVVADGVGGLSHGAIASRTAADVLALRLEEHWRQAAATETGREALQAAIAAAHEDLLAAAAAPMSTTLTAILLERCGAVVAHIGDSRAYLYREGELVQLTTDHTLVQDLVSLGQISVEEAARRTDRNVLTRALGYAREAPVDFRELRVQAEDRLLLCSDGIHNLISFEELAEILEQSRGGEAIEEMFRRALSRGAEDNLTAVLAQCQAAEEDEPVEA